MIECRDWAGEEIALTTTPTIASSDWAFDLQHVLSVVDAIDLRFLHHNCIFSDFLGESLKLVVGITDEPEELHGVWRQYHIFVVIKERKVLSDEE